MNYQVPLGSKDGVSWTTTTTTTSWTATTITKTPYKLHGLQKFLQNYNRAHISCFNPFNWGSMILIFISSLTGCPDPFPLQIYASQSVLPFICTNRNWFAWCSIPFNHIKIFISMIDIQKFMQQHQR